MSIFFGRRHFALESIVQREEKSSLASFLQGGFYLEDHPLPSSDVPQGRGTAGSSSGAGSVSRTNGSGSATLLYTVVNGLVEFLRQGGKQNSLAFFLHGGFT